MHFGLDSDTVYEVPEENREFGIHPLDRLLELYDALLAKSISALKGVGHQQKNGYSGICYS